MGKPDEALSVCLNAKEHLYSDEAVQIDDLTLSTLQIVFQRLDRCLSILTLFHDSISLHSLFFFILSMLV